jgi:hypothetical protein
MYELRVELLALLERGIEAGWGRKALSKAAEMNLPSLSRLLDSKPTESQ